MSKVKIIKSKNLKPKFDDPNKLQFGRLYTDHMFQMEYTPEKGWHNAVVKPYENICLDPACMVFHYGQEIFEGMKGYLSPDKKPLLFRPDENFSRMNRSAARLNMAQIDEELALEGLNELLKLEQGWIPDAPGTSLYIRPTMIASDPYLGVRPSDNYIFFIILSPVGAYYAAGFNPIKIYVEDEYVRAVRGGVGFTKAGGNYAASLAAGSIAKEKGFAQVLWLDAIERKYCEEVGSMNIFFVFEDEVVTPALSGSILPGITRKSVMQLLGDRGIKVVERPIAIDEIYDRHKKGELKEIFGTGTAAIVSPVGIMQWKGETITINDNKTGDLTLSLFNELLDIQNGKSDNKYGWSYEVK